MYIEFQITNLADLLKVAQKIQAEVAAIEKPRKVQPSEILIGTVVAPSLNLTLTDIKFESGCTTYTVEASA